MIQAIQYAIDKLFFCAHENLSRPWFRPGSWPKEHYKTCMDCGAELEYSLEQMKVVRN